MIKLLFRSLFRFLAYLLSFFQIKNKKIRELVYIIVFQLCLVFTFLTLLTLILRVIDESFGFVLTKNTKQVSEVFGETTDPNSLTKTQLINVMKDNMRRGTVRTLDTEKPLAQRTEENLLDLINEFVLEERVIKTWSLYESIFTLHSIRRIHESTPHSQLKFRNWINLTFLINKQSSFPEFTGIRSALLGSVFIVCIALAFSLPLGVASAVYLEEYATKNRLNSIIQTNIYNLTGIPSILYGILGLAIFVRLLLPLTQGRTILSAGLTLGLLCLPIIIINSQEAIKAVPNSLRNSSYGVGATKWQTVWHHVLPGSYERILTGVILAISRAIGETAPLVVVGAATFITTDPTGLFSKFTALPIQIYQWTARPQESYHHVAAAAIIILLFLIISLNSTAIILRKRVSQRKIEQ